MKILFFVEGLHAGGKERRVVELIKGLHKKHSIELVLTEKDVHYAEIFDLDFPIHYLVRKSIKKDPSLFYRFYKIAKQFKPDIIHTWGFMSTTYSIPTAFILKCYLVNSFISNAPKKIDINGLYKRLLFKFSDKIISNSKAGLIAYNAPKRKSEVIYNGFNKNRLNSIIDKGIIKKRYSISGGFIIGMVASFSHRKDYETYIDAAISMCKRNSELTFLCVGGGENRKLYSLVEKNKLEKRILFLGKCSDVESIMNVCDVGVLTSYNEGISNAIMEFMALGKPVVVTAGGGTNELIKNNYSGFLIEQQSPSELIEKLEFFYNNQQAAIDFGTYGKVIIEENFNITKMITKYESVYEKSRN